MCVCVCNYTYINMITYIHTQINSYKLLYRSLSSRLHGCYNVVFDCDGYQSY